MDATVQRIREIRRELKSIEARRPELWLKVKHIISLTSDRLYLHHQAEAEEAARIWHCHASPRKNPEMEDIWKK